MKNISGFQKTCSQCKVAASLVTTPMYSQATIKCITQVISQAISNLQTSFSNTIVQSETTLRAELNTISDKVNSVETAFSSKCSSATTKQIVQA